MAETNDTTAAVPKTPLGVMVVACVSTLIVNANTSAVTILLPEISEDVGTPVSVLQWAVTGYLLVGRCLHRDVGRARRRVRTAQGVRRRTRCCSSPRAR